MFLKKIAKKELNLLFSSQLDNLLRLHNSPSSTSNSFWYRTSNIVRPHPYADSLPIEYDNNNEVIPEVTIDELINIVLAKKKKKSLDTHDTSNYMFNFLDLN
ncbi:unnamed protein product [Rotaria sordida]|uniref:Uncharacterized protein n=1 Tax=Rotaria sordida TaxID=392033 RepID=A0A815UYZ2_9BILA|nr:unnamed protein product [Rotaria sordida]CAF1523684.1 unnamed protein product [Rotaria sordida]